MLSFAITIVKIIYHTCVLWLNWKYLSLFWTAILKMNTLESNINLLDILDPSLDLTPLMSQHSRYLSNLRRLGQV